jgi:L-amino acid N-acyltransferase YncA
LTLVVRPTRRDDLEAARAILNRIIEIGGTTAHQAPLDAEGFAQLALDWPDLIASHVVLDPQGRVAGFQTLERRADLPEGWGDIATFTRREPPLKGAGRALFAATCTAARQAGLTGINATIRADNAPGLGYYAAIGFRDHGVSRAVPLADGRPVDRIHRRFDLAAAP